MNPYTSLDSNAFWKNGVTQGNPFNPEQIYTKKWSISNSCRIATAGSCFAQHISRHLLKSGFSVIDAEPAPPALPQTLRKTFGYSLYSARYGNIYTTKQLLQLTQEVMGLIDPAEAIWRKDNRYFDAFRPGVEPAGLRSSEEVHAHRKFHLSCVADVLRKMDVFIFTLGLTEAWRDKNTKMIFPIAPGVIAGTYSDSQYEFASFSFQEITESLEEFQRLTTEFRGGKSFKMILTVSPVPLTATASGKHVLTATTLSKAILRAAAGYMESSRENIDYFPSYEIISNPNSRGIFYEENLRTVRPEGVETVMKIFFSEHRPYPFGTEPKAQVDRVMDPTTCEPLLVGDINADLCCEEQLLDQSSK